MNRKGFTLVELVAVVFLMALVLLFVVPSIRGIMKDNRVKEYETYEDMMVEYTKSYPNYKSKNYICLKDLNMEKITPKVECKGYVEINDNELTPYISCMQDEKETYKTEGYNLPSDCE